MKQKSIPDELNKELFDVYTKEFSKSNSSEQALTEACSFIVSKGIVCTRLTVQRTIARCMSGVDTTKVIQPINGSKIDTSREDEITIINNEIEDRVDVLLTRFRLPNKTDAEVIELSNAINKAQELRIKLLSLSPKKSVTAMEIKEGEARIVVSNIENIE